MTARTWTVARFAGAVAALLALTTAVPAAAAPSRVDVIVVLEDGSAPPGLVARQVRDAYGARIGAVYTHALKGFSASLPEAALAGLANDPRVAWIEADIEVRIAQTDEEVVPTGIDRIDADVNPMSPSLGLSTNDHVEVAVLDTGIKSDHPDLHVVAYTDCTDVLAFEVFGQLILSGSCAADGDPTDEDGHGHGTHVAGTIGATAGNGLGVVGAAPDVRLWSVKVLEDDGTGGLGGILAGIDLVARYADNIAAANMSFGFEGSSAALDTAVTNAVNAGVVFVAAAGNGAIDVSGFSPASNPDAVTVSALHDWDGAPGGLGTSTNCYPEDPDDTLAPFSNFGAGIDLAAPGTCILSTYNTGGYAWGSGTSMAAPHVTGAIARHIAEQEAANGPFPNDRSGVDAILDGFFATYTVPADDPAGFTDDSGDDIPEPLLYLGGGTEPPPNLPPTAAFAASCSGLECVFTNGSSDDDPGSLTYEWDFGDQTTSVVASPTHAYEAAGTFTVTLTATDGGGLADSVSQDVTVTAPALPQVHVGDLDASSVTGSRGRWDAVVTVTVHDASHAALGEGLTVTGVWGDGASGGGQCVTDASGACAVTKQNLRSNASPVTFTVTDVIGSVEYAPGANHDPDADSDGTTITVSKDAGTDPPPGGATVHVAGLSGTSLTAARGRWEAIVTIAVAGADGSPVAGVLVDGTWGGAAKGSGSCTTDDGGTCSVSKANLKPGSGPATYTVDVLSADGYAHDPGADTASSIEVDEPAATAAVRAE